MAHSRIHLSGRDAEDVGRSFNRLYYDIPSGLASTAGALGSGVLGAVATRKFYDYVKRPSGVSFPGRSETLVERAWRHVPPFLTGVAAIRHGRSALRQARAAWRTFSGSRKSSGKSAAKYAPGRSHQFQHWRVSSRPRKFIGRRGRYGQLSYGRRRSLGRLGRRGGLRGSH